MLDGLVSSVNAKQAQADQITQSVLLGDSGQLHQSVIAMQEASVSSPSWSRCATSSSSPTRS
jgi:flagellar hook-basal body complex protein FliE